MDIEIKTIKMKAPAGATSINFPARNGIEAGEAEVQADGSIEIPTFFTDDARSHGYEDWVEPAKPVEPAKGKKANIGEADKAAS